MALFNLVKRILAPIESERRRGFAKSMDGSLPSPQQMQMLGRMTMDALLAIRGNSQKPSLVFAVADAFHNLPESMFEPTFKWSSLLMFLEGLERECPDLGRRFLADFDAIIGFKVDESA